MKPLSFMEHKQIFDETGIDVDGTSRGQAFNFNVDADRHVQHFQYMLVVTENI